MMTTYKAGDRVKFVNNLRPPIPFTKGLLVRFVKHKSGDEILNTNRGFVLGAIYKVTEALPNGRLRFEDDPRLAHGCGVLCSTEVEAYSSAGVEEDCPCEEVTDADKVRGAVALLSAAAGGVADANHKFAKVATTVIEDVLKENKTLVETNRALESSLEVCKAEIRFQQIFNPPEATQARAAASLKLCVVLDESAQGCTQAELMIRGANKILRLTEKVAGLESANRAMLGDLNDTRRALSDANRAINETKELRQQAESIAGLLKVPLESVTGGRLITLPVDVAQEIANALRYYRAGVVDGTRAGGALTRLAQFFKGARERIR